MNILIVDDEYYIVQGILNNIDWPSLGIEKTLFCYSADQAMKIFMEDDVDILLTDIAMPKKSGLDLIQWVNDNGYTPIKLLLTGHQDFNYAQTAINLGCSQYIVKPVQPKKLYELLQEATDKARRNRSASLAQKMAASWDTDNHLKQVHFWTEIFKTKKSLTSTELQNTLDRYSLPSQWTQRKFGFLVIQGYPTQDGLPVKDLSESLIHMFPEYENSFIYKEDTSKLILIDPIDADQSNQIFKLLTEVYAMYRFVLFQSHPVSLVDVPRFYSRVNHLIETTFPIENIHLIIDLLLDINPVKQLPIEQLSMDLWPQLIIKGKTQEIINNIKRLFIRKTALYPIHDLRTIYQGIIHAVLSVLETLEFDSKGFLSSIQSIEDHEEITASAENFIVWAQQTLYYVNEMIQSQNDADPFLNTVKQYIKNNLSSPELNRNSIADVVHMNPDYISHLFHKHSGEHLNAYITKERIELAKRLILTSNRSLQEISDAAGFSTPSYFHRQFKKSTGTTPQQYKANH